VVITCVGDCFLQTDKPSQYISSHQGQLSPPSLQRRKTEYQSVWLGFKVGHVHVLWVTGNTVWSHMADDAPNGNPSVVVDVASPVVLPIWGKQMPQRKGIPPDRSIWRWARVSISP